MLIFCGNCSCYFDVIFLKVGMWVVVGYSLAWEECPTGCKGEGEGRVPVLGNGGELASTVSTYTPQPHSAHKHSWQNQIRNAFPCPKIMYIMNECSCSIMKWNCCWGGCWAYSHPGIISWAKLHHAMLMLLLFEGTGTWALWVAQSCTMQSFCCCQGREGGANSTIFFSFTS